MKVIHWVCDICGTDRVGDAIPPPWVNLHGKNVCAVCAIAIKNAIKNAAEVTEA